MNTEITKIRELIESSKHVTVIFDSDTDGSCSYLQLKNSFSQIKYGFACSKDNQTQKQALENISSKTDLILFFDTPFIHEFMFEELKEKKIVWVDHHPENDSVLAKKYNVLHFNPLNYNSKDSRCSSFWAYQIANSKKNLFYVTMASVADFYLLDVIQELYEYNKEEFNLLFKITDKKREELFSFLQNYDFKEASVQDQRAQWIRFLSYDCGLIKFKYCFDLLYKLTRGEHTQEELQKISKLSLQEFKYEIEERDSDFYLKLRESMKAEQKLVKKALKEFKGKEVVWLEYEYRFSLSRQIVEELNYKLKGAQVIVCAFRKESKNLTSYAFRSRGVDVNKLIRNSLKGLEGQGGGHKFSAGGITSLKDSEEFKRRVLQKLSVKQ